MRWLGIITLLAASLAVSGCANMLSIGRTSLLPAGKSTQDGPTGIETQESTGGVAVHLDAQQRAIIHAGARYCAEPSPDAIAAVAAAAGFGASVPGSGAGSASNALSSAVSSIGLRTQSIQLMRDSLYRLCEAANNGRINESDMAMLLRRSQDLTAVVVAVEQLTGAVVAQQAAVTTNAQASASASLVANQQLLGEMEDQVAKKQAAVDEAQAALDSATAARDSAATDKATADAQADQAAKDTAKTNLESKQRIVDNRERDLELRKQQLADAQRVRDEIKAARDSALTNSNSATGGSAQFSQAQQRKQLDDAASQKIATVVGEMVEAVLKKEYTIDHCMTLLSTAKNEGSVAVQICKEIMIKSAEKALGMTISTYGSDPSTDQLNGLLKSGKVTTTQLKTWLKDPKNRAGTTSVTFFKTGSEFAAKRREFINSVN